MSGAERYIKVVEWSDEDGAFVGQCPGVIGPCCHGSDEVEVYRELCEIVAEWVEIAERDGTPLPPPPRAPARPRRSRCSPLLTERHFPATAGRVKSTRTTSPAVPVTVRFSSRSAPRSVQRAVTSYRNSFPPSSGGESKTRSVPV